MPVDWNAHTFRGCSRRSDNKCYYLQPESNTPGSPEPDKAPKKFEALSQSFDDFGPILGNDSDGKRIWEYQINEEDLLCEQDRLIRH